MPRFLLHGNTGGKQLNLSKTKIAVKPHERKPRQPGIRQEMLAGLPEEIEEYVIPTDETCGICGGKMKVISKKLVRTEVEYRPAKIVVKHVVQQIAKCMECGKPGSPNDKSNFRKASVPVSEVCDGTSTFQTGKRLVPIRFGIVPEQYGKLGDPMQSGLAGTCLLADS